MSRSWPLTGRAEELQMINAAMSNSGEHRGIVLAGAAGVGKTRLAHETLTMARHRHQLVRWVAASASARVLPLGVFSGVCRATGGDPLGLVREVMDALLVGADRRGVVVGVDDAHLLDEQSASTTFRG
jgi:AAA ATPase domain